MPTAARPLSHFDQIRGLENAVCLRSSHVNDLSIVTICILNNSNLQYIKENQRLLHQGRYISTDFTELDYAAIARAFGCAGIRVNNSSKLGSALSEAMNSDLPTVVDIRVLDNVVPERIHLQKLD